MIGDFNSNVIWNKSRKDGNHSTFVQKLEAKGIFSAYHKFHRQIQGKEQHSTLFMYRHLDEPYHIDYCFASADYIDMITNVEIGVYDDWTQYSDHIPLSVTFVLN